MLRAFRASPTGLVSLLAVCAVVLLAIVAPLIWSGAADKIEVVNANQVASWSHPLGTDELGRDILTRLLVGTRLSIVLSLTATAISVVIGAVLGAAATVLPPRVRSLELQAIDAMLAFPGILVAISIGAVIGPGPIDAAVSIGVATSFPYARVFSALALTMAGREYILAARVVGVRGFPLLLRYVIPNMAETLVLVTFANISSAIVDVSSLSFLGLGVQPPQFDWGRLLIEGVMALYINPMAAIGPAIAIGLTALSFGLAGEAIARAMNPMLWTRHAAGLETVSGVNPAWRATGSNSATRLGPSDEGAPVLDVRNLSVQFPGPGGNLQLVSDVSFAVRRGERVGIVGESGSGKTMLALAIAQLIPHPGQSNGTVALKGRPVTELTPHDLASLLGLNLAVVFQDPSTSLNPALKVGTQLVEGPRVHRRLGRRQARTLAEVRLREVGLAAPKTLMERRQHQLSGGMRQRVMVAMGLMNEPGLLIADEPTTALDVTIQAQIMRLLREVTLKHGTAILLISHNLALVGQNCDRVLVMYSGKLVEDLSTEQLTTSPLHPYTRGLLSVVPDLDRPQGGPLGFIPGEPPDPASRPPGCPYHPRCPLAMYRCRSEMPALVTRSDGHRVACWAVEPETR